MLMKEKHKALREWLKRQDLVWEDDALRAVNLQIYIMRNKVMSHVTHYIDFPIVCVEWDTIMALWIVIIPMRLPCQIKVGAERWNRIVFLWVESQSRLINGSFSYKSLFWLCVIS